MSQMFKRSIAVAASTLIASIGLVIGAGAASATACPSGSFCIWADANYTTGSGSLGTVKFVAFSKWIGYYGPSPAYNPAGYNYGGTTISANNNASSLSNNGTVSSVYLYDGGTCVGYPLVMLKGHGDGNLSDAVGWAEPGYNDMISSGAFEYYLNTCKF